LGIKTIAALSTDNFLCVECRLCDTTHKGLQRQYGRSTEGECSAHDNSGNTISDIGSFTGGYSKSAIIAFKNLFVKELCVGEKNK
jgi:hypothetical protein